MTIQQKIEGKKVLLFSLQTFNYEQLIIDKLRAFGAIVDFYDERPANSILIKGIIRLRRSLLQLQINKYYRRLLNDVSTVKYDFLFVITGEVIPDFFLAEFKKKNPSCYCIYYTWDSFANCSHPLIILKHFDKCFTFDHADALKYNLNFRPLFYSDKFEELSNNNMNYKYKLLFVGTAHSDRHKIVSQIATWCKSNNMSYFIYYYIQSWLVFLYKYFFDSTFKKVSFFDMNFSSLSIDRVLELYSQAEIILDVNHPFQTGLTMRTFEALGAEKKLITTNSAIKEYNFYNENNIYIIDRENPVVPIEFFESKFIPVPDNLKFRMSISGWLTELFLNDGFSPDWIEK
jgi:hypothetical protein